MADVHKFRPNRDLSLSPLISFIYSPSLQMSVHSLADVCVRRDSPPYLSFRPLKSVYIHFISAQYTFLAREFNQGSLI